MAWMGRSCCRAFAGPRCAAAAAAVPRVLLPWLVATHQSTAVAGTRALQLRRPRSPSPLIALSWVAVAVEATVGAKVAPCQGLVGSAKWAMQCIWVGDAPLQWQPQWGGEHTRVLTSAFVGTGHIQLRLKLARSLAVARRWMPCHAVLCHAVLCCAVLCCAVLCCAVLCGAVLCCAVLCGAVLCCAVLCGAVLCCAVLCGAVLCCAVLCCAVLCCAVLCGAVLCCAVLC
jgi:hypothetical protein